jgi:transposase-like protein
VICKKRRFSIEEKMKVLMELGMPEAFDGQGDHPQKGLLKASAVHAVMAKYGMSRATLFNWRRRLVVFGETGLRDKSPIRVNPPPRISETLKNRVIEISLLHPQWGCKSIAAQLRAEAMPLSAVSVQKVLKEHGRRTREDRGGVEVPRPTGHPAKKKQGAARKSEAKADTPPPEVTELKSKIKLGQYLAQSLRSVRLPGNGESVFVHEVVDLKSSFSAVIVAAHRRLEGLKEVLLPVSERLWKLKEVKSLRVITRGALIDTGLFETYRRFLEARDISANPETRRWLVHWSVADRFHEVFSKQFISKQNSPTHVSTIDLQQRVKTWIKSYNDTPEAWNGGKSPNEVLSG